MKLIKGMRQVKPSRKSVYAWFLLENQFLFYKYNSDTKVIHVIAGMGTYSKEYLRKWGYEEIEIV